MRKTALAELIEKLTSKIKSITATDIKSRYQKGAYVDALLEAKALLPKEREQIEQTFGHGFDNAYEGNNTYNEQAYFDNTYTQQP